MLTPLLCLAALAHPHPADPTDSARHSIGLDEAIVVETKQNKRSLAPASVSLIPAASLQAQEVRQLKDLTASIPNFYMPDYGSKQNAPVYIRGIGAKAKGPTVAFYVDGVPYHSHSAFDLDLNDIAQVAVMRGPQGTLFGRNAIGGTIALTSRSPLSDPGQRVHLGVGNYGERRVQYALHKRITPTFGLSATAGYHHTEFSYDNITTGKKVDVLDEGYARLAFVWQVAPQWRLRLNTMLDKADQGGYPYARWDVATNTVSPIS